MGYFYSLVSMVCIMQMKTQTHGSVVAVGINLWLWFSFIATVSKHEIKFCWHTAKLAVIVR